MSTSTPPGRSWTLPQLLFIVQIDPHGPGTLGARGCQARPAGSPKCFVSVSMALTVETPAYGDPLPHCGAPAEHERRPPRRVLPSESKADGVLA